MKVSKTVSVGGKWAKVNEDYKNNDVIVLTDAGKEVEGEYGPQNVFSATMPNGEKRAVSINQTSLNYLVDAYGEDTDAWINQEIRANVIKQMVQGKFKNVTYWTAPDQELSLE